VDRLRVGLTVDATNQQEIGTAECHGSPMKLVVSTIRLFDALNGLTLLYYESRLRVLPSIKE
jgi:hypothetical protein